MKEVQRSELRQSKERIRTKCWMFLRNTILGEAKYSRGEGGYLSFRMKPLLRNISTNTEGAASEAGLAILRESLALLKDSNMFH